jgi:hypothetical protein
VTPRTRYLITTVEHGIEPRVHFTCESALADVAEMAELVAYRNIEIRVLAIGHNTVNDTISVVGITTVNPNKEG